MKKVPSAITGIDLIIREKLILCYKDNKILFEHTPSYSSLFNLEVGLTKK